MKDKIRFPRFPLFLILLLQQMKKGNRKKRLKMVNWISTNIFCPSVCFGFFFGKAKIIIGFSFSLDVPPKVLWEKFPFFALKHVERQEFEVAELSSFSILL
jgi:hypothetical protein